MDRKQLKQLRVSKNHTQESFAELLGMSKSGYSKLEQGERKISKPIERLAQVVAPRDQSEITKQWSWRHPEAVG